MADGFRSRAPSVEAPKSPSDCRSSHRVLSALVEDSPTLRTPSPLGIAVGGASMRRGTNTPGPIVSIHGWLSADGCGRRRLADSPAGAGIPVVLSYVTYPARTGAPAARAGVSVGAHHGYHRRHGPGSVGATRGVLATVAGTDPGIAH